MLVHLSRMAASHPFVAQIRQSVEGRQRHGHERLSAMTEQNRCAQPVVASRIQIVSLAFCLVLGLLCFTELANVQCRFSPDRVHREITYRFHPEVTPYGLILHVTLETKTEPSGQLLLNLPSQWAGEQLHASVSVGTDAGTKKLTFYPRGKPVKVWQYIHDAAHPCKTPFSSGL